MTLDTQTVRRVDRLVRDARYPKRSQAIEAAVAAQLERLEGFADRETSPATLSTVRHGASIRRLGAIGLLLAAVATSLRGQTNPPLWTGSARTAVFVTMRDGTRLAVDWVVPTGWRGTGPAPTRFPTVFRYTPYGRSFLDPKTGKVPVEPFFLERGYAPLCSNFLALQGPRDVLTL